MASTAATSGRACSLTTTAPMTVTRAPRLLTHTSRTATACTMSRAMCGSGRATGSVLHSISRWATSADRAITHRVRLQVRPRPSEAGRISATTHTATDTELQPAPRTHPTARQATSAFAALETPDTACHCGSSPLLSCASILGTGSGGT